MGKERVVKKERHNPLHVQLLEDKMPGKKNSKVKSTRRNQEKERDDVY
jgi:hypothetical protein